VLVPSELQSNKELVEYLLEEYILRRGERGREGMAAIPP
jgi:hypothetical protein